MANRTSIYRKEIMKQGLEGNVHNFMRVYYPEYYKLSQEDQYEMRKLFYGDKVNSIYTSVLIDAINKVNLDEDLLKTRVFDVKSNPAFRLNKVEGEHQDIAVHKIGRCSEETINKQKNWFEEQYPKLVDRLKKEYEIEDVENADSVLLKILMKDFKMTLGQAEKIVKKYYISEISIDMINKYIVSGEKDTSVIEIKNQNKKGGQVPKTKIERSKTKEQIFCAKHNDEIFKAIKSKYPNAKTFIEKENMPFSTSAYHQSRSKKRYSRIMAVSLVRWYEENKPIKETNDVVDVKNLQLKMEIPEEKEEVVIETNLKPIVNIFKKGILGRKVVDEYKLSIISKSLLNRLKNEELEEIRFIQEFEELENKLKTNDLSSLIRNTDDYQKNRRRYESISNDLKDLAKIIKY